jgi:hypothetical protein
VSDFSALCPLFSTGVYSELTLPYCNAGGVSLTEVVDAGYPFGRSVIITAAYLKKHTLFSATATGTKLYLCRQTSASGTATVFASIVLSATDTVVVPKQWAAFTVTATTFTATQVLAVRANKARTGMKHVSVIVRYKEK